MTLLKMVASAMTTGIMVGNDVGSLHSKQIFTQKFSLVCRKVGTYLQKYKKS